MATIKLNEIAKRLGNPSLRGRMNGTVLALQFLPDAYNAEKCAGADARLVDPNGYKSAMARFVTGNLQSNKSNRGHTELTQSLLDHLGSKTNTFTCRDGSEQSYYESMRANIGRLTDDPNHCTLNGDNTVWALADDLYESEEPVFRKIADAVVRKKNAEEWTDALFLLTLAAIFTRAKDLVQLSHLWEEERIAAPAPEMVCLTAKEAGAAAGTIPEVEYRLEPPLVDGYIHGYPEEAEQILKVLQEPGGNKVALSGMSGVGKSSLAAEIARQYKMDGKRVLWMDFKGNLRDTLCDDRNLAIRGLYRMNYRHKPDDYFRMKLEILQRQVKPDTLIVFDGWNHADKNLDELLRGDYPMLITTQDEQLDHRLTMIRIEHFPKESDRLALFRYKYGRDIAGEELEMVLKLLERWNYHTYATCLLAEAMRANPTMLTGVCADAQSGVLSAEADPMTAICPGLYEFVFTKSFPEEVRPQVLHLLRNLALLPESGVTRTQFGQWTGLTRQEDWALLQELLDRRLILLDPWTDTIHLHSMLVTLVLHDPGDGAWCAGLTEALVAACAKAPDAPYSKKLQLLEAVQSVYDRTAELRGTCVAETHREIGIRLGELLEMLGRYRESAEVFRILREKEENPEMQAFLYSGEAQGCIRSGNLEYGWFCALEGLERGGASRQLQGRLCRNLCECARFLRDYAAAVSYGNEAVRLLADCADERACRDLGWAYYHLGYALYMQDKRNESERCFVSAMAQFEKVGEASSRLYAEEMLSQLAMLDGHIGKALKHIGRSRATLLHCVGDRHVDYGRNLLYEGNIWRMAGDAEAAEKSFEEAFKLFDDLGCAQAEAAAEALHRDCIIRDIWAQDFAAVDVADIRAQNSVLCDRAEDRRPEVLCTGE